jgi:hypothetical protein
VNEKSADAQHPRVKTPLIPPGWAMLLLTAAGLMPPGEAGDAVPSLF